MTVLPVVEFALDRSSHQVKWYSVQNKNILAISRPSGFDNPTCAFTRIITAQPDEASGAFPYWAATWLFDGRIIINAGEDAAKDLKEIMQQKPFLWQRHTQFRVKSNDNLGFDILFAGTKCVGCADNGKQKWLRPHECPITSDSGELLWHPYCKECWNAVPQSTYAGVVQAAAK